MFVVRYLMVVLAVMAGISAWGIAAGYSAWQVLGMAFLAALVLQALILAYVGIAATRRGRGPSGGPSRGVRKRCDQLVILPR